MVTPFPRKRGRVSFDLDLYPCFHSVYWDPLPAANDYIDPLMPYLRHNTGKCEIGSLLKHTNNKNIMTLIQNCELDK